MNDKKIILDLCGGTGSWARPYKDAGYDVRTVTLPQNDVRNVHFYEEHIVFYGNPDFRVLKKDIYGILAAPPCTMFSMARTVAKTPRDSKGAMETVEACLKVVWECQYGGKRLKFWALENPKARLTWFLGKPAMTFEPYEFGTPYKKPTCLWGNFNAPKKNPIELPKNIRKQSQQNLQQLPKLPLDYIIPETTTKRQAARSITPAGFAKAFYEANK